MKKRPIHYVIIVALCFCVVLFGTACSSCGSCIGSGCGACVNGCVDCANSDGCMSICNGCVDCSSACTDAIEEHNGDK